ncbi:hypothetical protein C1T31_00540 [Hanstruepera neustonica]|uniref:Lipid/polyisoprenoid-binding YceI-like domain-containing protein n=1 Tax=Hanstruepera neustonica TaxID=1445657 RepID=A0A2K1E337_9FLAO|nr:YceI family protein [Hanstruepera neustonica]PNQ74667.1 hypothetical protein C1T31_00540 [Hanstruepera neustonica]
MKKIVCIMLLGFALLTQAQSKYMTKTGSVTFEASVPSFEEVKATNASTTAILNSENGEFAALILVKGFRLKNALMEEHFNENYAESNTYPKATFKGTFKNFSSNKLSGTYTIDGTLTFHGVSKYLKDIKVTLTELDNILKLTGNFNVLASDFKIDIPKIVSNKLSNEVAVNFEFELLEK